MSDEVDFFGNRPGLAWTERGFELHVHGTLPGPRTFATIVASSAFLVALAIAITGIVGQLPQVGMAPVPYLVGFALVTLWWGRGKRRLTLRGGPGGLEIRHYNRLLVSLSLPEVQSISQEDGWIRVRGPRGIVWLDARDHAGLGLTQALSQLQDERVRQLLAKPEDAAARKELEDLLSAAQYPPRQ